MIKNKRLTIYNEFTNVVWQITAKSVFSKVNLIHEYELWNKLGSQINRPKNTSFAYYIRNKIDEYMDYSPDVKYD